MDKSIEKFLKYLHDFETQIKIDAVKAMREGALNKDLIARLELLLVEVRNFVKLLTTKREYGENHGQVFVDFNRLSYYLDKSNLGTRDCYNIILYFIKKNMASGLLSTDDASVLLIDLKSLPVITDNKEVIAFIEDLIDRDAVGDFLISNLHKMNDVAREAFEIIELCTVDLAPYRDSTITLRDSYIEKDDVTEEDARLIEITLIDIGLSDKCINLFMYFVNKKQAKRQVVAAKPTGIRKEESKGPRLITEKEFKAMKREIKSTFDVYSRTLLRPLSYDEAIYIAYLMVRLGYNEYDIINLFRASIESNYLNIWGIADFLQNREKFRYYMSEEDYNSVLEYLAEADNDPASCEFWLHEAKKLINKAAENFGAKYEYEMSLAKSYNESGKKG